MMFKSRSAPTTWCLCCVYYRSECEPAGKLHADLKSKLFNCAMLTRLNLV